ncbi:MAG: glycosyltransferase family 9 protein [Alphaproteobacteria bacterium]|nr:glycosyltransferase family 9 protein [Alphaproteobacteria bacterium]
MKKERILVIRLSALGDIVMAMDAMASIRAHHPKAEIGLLTMPAFAPFAHQMPWFDRVMIDPRPNFTQIIKWIKLGKELRAFAPTMVYDLQCKPRQSILFHLLGRPAWCGTAKGCLYPRPLLDQRKIHVKDGYRLLLGVAGVPVKSADLDWFDDPLDGFDLPARYTLLIAGCSPQHPHKRWPIENYAALAQALAEKGIASIAIGTKAESAAIDELCCLVPSIINLTDKTSLKQIAALARRAHFVIGNDTGPIHIAAAVGAKTLALFSDRGTPAWSHPSGPDAQWLQGHPLAKLEVSEVLKVVTCK